MKRRLLKFRVWLITVLIILLPDLINAQRSDGFFRGNDEIIYDNRTDGVGLDPAQQENPTPLGNGLLVMLAAGVGYVTLKKKKGNKKTLLVALLAMILLFAQCKKTNPSVIDDGVYITLNAGYDGKTAFTPSSGEFVWSYGVTEYIYVGGNVHSSCLGVLSGTGTGTSNMTFSGTLTTTPNNGETLYFFYLGKGRNGLAVTTLDFSNQDGTLENVTNFHVAVGVGSYTSGTVNYATSLAMKMAIAYFDVSEFQNINETAEVVYLHGGDIYSKATINYRKGTITGSTKGFISLGASNSGKYIAMIPSTESETTIKFDSNNKTGLKTFMNGIKESRYYSNNTEAIPITMCMLPEGIASGLFSVSATKMIRFSKGNLQYNASNNTWRFSDDQWSYIGNDNVNVSSTYDGWIDLFGWGTSGYNHGANCYQPWSISTDYGDYFAYGSYMYNLEDQTGKADWGYNVIDNGGNVENNWHTLKKDEWVYLFNRSTKSNIKYAKANVNGINEVLLLPDGWDSGIYNLSSTNTSDANYTSNIISVTEWSDVLTTNGVVFLPAAGYRSGTSVNFVGSISNYWSSTHGGVNDAYSLYFDSFSLYPSSYYDGRYDGFSVRLVHDVE